MTKEQIETYQRAASLGLIPDEENPIFLFSLANKSLLIEIIDGALDVKELARMELYNRGLNDNGQFIGWQARTYEPTQSV